jgi:cell division protein FtsB
VKQSLETFHAVLKSHNNLVDENRDLKHRVRKLERQLNDLPKWQQIAESLAEELRKGLASSVDS